MYSLPRRKRIFDRGGPYDNLSWRLPDQNSPDTQAFLNGTPGQGGGNPNMGLYSGLSQGVSNLGDWGRNMLAGNQDLSQYQDPTTQKISSGMGSLGSTAMGLAAFTGPAAPFVFAGGAALSLGSAAIGALGDDKAEKRKKASDQLSQENTQKIMNYRPEGRFEYEPTFRSGGFFLRPSVGARGGAAAFPSENRYPGSNRQTYRENGGLLTRYNGYPHEMGGIPLGQGAEVEDKETSKDFPGVGKYIFSDSLKYGGKQTYAGKSKQIDTKYSFRPDDKIDQDAKERELTALMNQQEMKRYQMGLADDQDFLARYGGEIEPLMFKSGGIYIKPENRGKFNATKARTGKTTEELTHSSNPITRKRAIFAQNAAKFKHTDGGPLQKGVPPFMMQQYLNSVIPSQEQPPYGFAGENFTGGNVIDFLEQQKAKRGIVPNTEENDNFQGSAANTMAMGNRLNQMNYNPRQIRQALQGRRETTYGNPIPAAAAIPSYETPRMDIPLEENKINVPKTRGIEKSPDTFKPTGAAYQKWLKDNRGRIMKDYKIKTLNTADLEKNNPEALTKIRNEYLASKNRTTGRSGVSDTNDMMDRRFQYGGVMEYTYGGPKKKGPAGAWDFGADGVDVNYVQNPTLPAFLVNYQNRAGAGVNSGMVFPNEISTYGRVGTNPPVRQSSISNNLVGNMAKNSTKSNVNSNKQVVKSPKVEVSLGNKQVDVTGGGAGADPGIGRMTPRGIESIIDYNGRPTGPTLDPRIEPGQILPDYEQLDENNWAGTAGYIPGYLASTLPYLYDMTRKADRVAYDRVNPYLVNYEPERTSARREAGISRGIIGRNAQNMGMSRGQIMNNIMAGNSMVNRGLGDQVGQSYQNQANMNAGILGQTSAMNAQIQMAEANAQEAENARINTLKSHGLHGIGANTNAFAKDLIQNYQQNMLMNNFMDTENFGVNRNAGYIGYTGEVDENGNPIVVDRSGRRMVKGGRNRLFGSNNNNYYPRQNMPLPSNDQYSEDWGMYDPGFEMSPEQIRKMRRIKTSNIIPK